MLFIFSIPYYPGLGDFSFIINSYATNAMFLTAYALITKSEVNEIRFPIVTLLLVPLDFAAMLAGGFVSWSIVSMPYWLWGDWRLMDELARYRGRTRSTRCNRWRDNSWICRILRLHEGQQEAFSDFVDARQLHLHARNCNLLRSVLLRYAAIQVLGGDGSERR